ncbi:MAG: amino acid ABC transporter substrate-binding protein [Burkholderiaceae bacterium]|jgi:ABC-type amino acid transport substrate-binding protein
MLRTVFAALTALMLASAVQAQPLEGRLKRIAETKTIAIAHRTDAMPFSFTENGQVTGFTVDLCKRVVTSIERQINVPGLQIKWVPVTSQNRFDVVASGQADLECGASTVTLSRLRQVDFSSFIFIETTSLLVKSASGLQSFADVAGKKIAVVAGTTNERAVQAQLKRRQINATVLPMKTREQAFDALESGAADAFASDRLLLLGSFVKAKDPKAMAILGDELSMEPYGIALPRGDAALRLAVNTGLSQVFGSGEIGELFKTWFGQLGRPSVVLEVNYLLGTIPD